jgi:hypothetical protein
MALTLNPACIQFLDRLCRVRRASLPKPEWFVPPGGAPTPETTLDTSSIPAQHTLVSVSSACVERVLSVL